MMNHHIPCLQLYAAMGTRQDEEDLSSDDSESYDSESMTEDAQDMRGVRTIQDVQSLDICYVVLL